MAGAEQVPRPSALSGRPHPPRRSAIRLRAVIPRWQAITCGLSCVLFVLGLWWLATRGESADQRWVAPHKLPSVQETFSTFRSLWFDRALTRNTWASLRRVALGFGLAAMVGVPIGVLSGCFTRLAAFMAPLTIFGRNIPMAALIPLSIILFGIDEMQKVMFIFLSAVAFVIADTAHAVSDVPQRYVDTAYTLGASRWQVIIKVLVPLAMPKVFNSLRLLFGLAFGYIMLAEVIQVGSESGLGGIINTSQRRGPKEHIYLVLLIIPAVALAIDRSLFWIQKQLFPYQYGGSGLLARTVRHGLGVWEQLKAMVLTPTPLAETKWTAGLPAAATSKDPPRPGPSSISPPRAAAALDPSSSDPPSSAGPTE